MDSLQNLVSEINPEEAPEQEVNHNVIDLSARRQHMLKPGSRAAFQAAMHAVKPATDENGNPYTVAEPIKPEIFTTCKHCKCKVNESTPGFLRNATGRAEPCPVCTPIVKRNRAQKKINDLVKSLVDRHKLLNEENFPFDASELTMAKFPSHGDQKAKQEIQRFIDGESFNLFLTGMPGLGKSGLQIAAAQALAEQGFKVLVLGCSEYINLLREKFDEENHIKEVARGIEILFLDDLGVDKASDSILQEIEDLIDHRRKAGLRTCISSNYDLKGLDGYWRDKSRAGFQPIDRFVDRLRGYYELVTFTGRSLR